VDVVSRKTHHDEPGEDVWNYDEIVASRTAEAYTFLQYDEKGVCDSISHSRREHKTERETANLKIHPACAVRPQVERFGDHVMAILLDVRNDELNFVLSQELLLRLAWFGGKSAIK
jgi:hypothetical protein